MLLFFSCNNRIKENADKPSVLIDWYLSQTRQYNYSSSFAGLKIFVKVKNNTDSILYLSNDYGEFHIRENKNVHLKFLSSSFNDELVYPDSIVIMEIIKSYYWKKNSPAPSKKDFDLEIYYKRNNAAFDKSSFYERNKGFERNGLGISRVVLLDSCVLRKTDDYEFEWIEDEIEPEI